MVLGATAPWSHWILQGVEPCQVAAGGVAGYASKGSVPSLVAGGLSGLGLIACGQTARFRTAAAISAPRQPKVLGQCVDGHFLFPGWFWVAWEMLNMPCPPVHL